MLPTVVNRNPDLVKLGIDCLTMGLILGNIWYAYGKANKYADELIDCKKELNDCMKERNGCMQEVIDCRKKLIDTHEHMEKQDAIIEKQSIHLIKLETVNELQAMLIDSQADTLSVMLSSDKRIDTPLELK